MHQIEDISLLFTHQLNVSQSNGGCEAAAQNPTSPRLWSQVLALSLSFSMYMFLVLHMIVKMLSNA